MKDHEIIIFLIIVSYLTRIFLTPFFVMFPYIPHDSYAHSGAGESMAEGNFFMETSKIFEPVRIRVSEYGPFFSTLMLLWYRFFGVYDFFMFKIPVIIFDVLNTLMVYFIGKKILGSRKAFYVSLLYCFSFIVLYNTAVLGDELNYSLLFMLFSTYCIINKKFSLSAVLFSAAMMFRFSPWVLFGPALLFYVFKKENLKESMKYILISGLSLLIMLSPFILLAGWYKTTYYIFGSNVGLQQSEDYKNYTLFLSIINVLNLVTNINLNFLSLPLLFVGYIITLILILFKRLKNAEIELLRNIVLLGIIGLLVGPGLAGQYMAWVIAFLFILFGLKFNEKRFTTMWLALGVCLIFVSLLIYSIIYREGIVQYSSLDRLLLIIVVIMAPIGTFYLFYPLDRNYRLIWVFIVLGTILSIEIFAAPLLIFPMKNFSERLINLSKFKVINGLYGDHIQGNPEIFVAYGSFYLGSAIILWFCLGLLYYSLLKDNLS
jgi:Gpi18-like mannosyltransferase